MRGNENWGDKRERERDVVSYSFDNELASVEIQLQ
jgi:hypothetical protein